MKLPKEAIYMHPLARESLNAGETLPPFYGEDTLVLLTRDPYWLFSYWELTPDTLSRSSAAGEPFEQMLRIKKFDHQGKEISFFDIGLDQDSSSWYVHAGEPDRTYQAELGLRMPDGSFKLALTSNKVHTPRDGVSSVIDPLWGYLNFWQQRLFYRTLKFNMNSAELIRREKALSGRKGGFSRE